MIIYFEFIFEGIVNRFMKLNFYARLFFFTFLFVESLYFFIVRPEP